MRHRLPSPKEQTNSRNACGTRVPARCNIFRANTSQRKDRHACARLRRLAQALEPHARTHLPPINPFAKDRSKQRGIRTRLDGRPDLRNRVAAHTHKRPGHQAPNLLETQFLCCGRKMKAARSGSQSHVQPPRDQHSRPISTQRSNNIAHHAHELAWRKPGFSHDQQIHPVFRYLMRARDQRRRCQSTFPRVK